MLALAVGSGGRVSMSVAVSVSVSGCVRVSVRAPILHYSLANVRLRTTTYLQ